jgi:TRAP-type uncharacterized transport system substrate-binding protein
MVTDGSGQNVEMLGGHEAQLGMYQGGTVALKDAAVVAPLYREVVHVLVRSQALEQEKYDGHELTGELLRDLLVVDGREVYAGSRNSGMRHSAREILAHYGIEVNEIPFNEKQTALTEVVISTTGMFSKAMQKRLKNGDFRYLTLNADAIAQRHSHFAVHTIPKASFRDERGQPIPSQDVSTVATPAFLVARRDASPKLIAAVLDALYHGELAREHPDLIPREEARAYLHGMPVHETAREYFYPYDYSYLTRGIESLAATKELLVALGAGLYLLWTLRSRRKERQRHDEREANRERLDRFLDRTVAIESAQIGVTDPALLAKHLEEVTRIKLEALDELTDAELRGDRVFSIFLMQCANLINRLQLKIIAHNADAAERDQECDPAE